MELICLTSHPNVAEFQVMGALNTLESKYFIDTLQAAITDQTKAMIIDCTEMPYLTSTGLRAIMIVGQKMKAAQAEFIICGLQGLALEIYTTSGFASVFVPEADLEKARQRAKAYYENA